MAGHELLKLVDAHKKAGWTAITKADVPVIKDAEVPGSGQRAALQQADVFCAKCHVSSCLHGRVKCLQIGLSTSYTSTFLHGLSQESA